ncbi:hypothetical protein [Streptomyces spororaveus]|nr:hypothetical protein [Streptomyces spororaveus]
MSRAKRRIADLEAVIASQQTGQDMPTPSTEWHLARQDPLGTRTTGDPRL